MLAPLRAALAQRLGHPVTHSVVYRLLARHGWRKLAPDTSTPKATLHSRSVGKKLTRLLAGIRRRTAVLGRPLRLRFQDEARFGGMLRIRRCWAQAPERPTVCIGDEREFVSVYGAVSLLQGAWAG